MSFAKYFLFFSCAALIGACSSTVSSEDEDEISSTSSSSGKKQSSSSTKTNTKSSSSTEEQDEECFGEPGKPWDGTTAKDFACGAGLSHYPVFCYNGQYRLDALGNPKSYMLYGHVHNSYDEVLINRFIRMTRESRRKVFGREGLSPIPCNMINCFCMFSDYTPLSLDEWIEVDRKRREALTEADLKGLLEELPGIVEEA